MFFVYILKSQLTGKHYYGHTKHIDVRLKEHNTGRVKSTKAYSPPWQVIYTESFETKSEAFKRELFFKSIDGYNFLKSQGII
ncbi:MAG: GIY-YIG nuclease family protein [Saprospiraceae bacterium]|nr:GIY-YIG nuclease family protein [Saprospiraceae bacterium]